MSLAYALRDGKQDYRVLLRDLEDVREGRNRDVEQQGEHALAAQLAATVRGFECLNVRIVEKRYRGSSRRYLNWREDTVSGCRDKGRREG